MLEGIHLDIYVSIFTFFQIKLLAIHLSICAQNRIWLKHPALCIQWCKKNESSTLRKDFVDFVKPCAVIKKIVEAGILEKVLRKN